MNFRENRLLNETGSQILTAVVISSILGIVIFGVSKAFFSIGRLKAINEAKTSSIDYETAFITGLGTNAMKALLNCSSSDLNNIDFAIGDLGSAKFLAGTTKTTLEQSLKLSSSSSGINQAEMKSAFDSCPESVSVPQKTDPGIYYFCVGFQGLQGSGFKGLLGAFAKVRLDLSSRDRSSDQRVLGQAITCEDFKTNASREIKISYKIYFKKFDDDSSIFTKAGVQFFSS